MTDAAAMPLLAFIILLAGFIGFASWLLYKERHNR